MTLQVSNNNPGTTYTSVDVRSLIHLIDLGGIDPTGTTGGLMNVNVGINTDDGYVNNGWIPTIHADGSIAFAPDPEDPFADVFTFNQVLSATVYINNLVCDPARIKTGPNAAGLTDSAYCGDLPWSTQPSMIPVLEPLPGALSLADVGGSWTAGTHRVVLSVASTNLPAFRILHRVSLASGGWTPLGTYAVTGGVTQVVDTNTVPTRFYQTVWP